MAGESAGVWTIHFDGGSRGNPGPAAAGVSVVDGDGAVAFEAGFFLGTMTNNQAEYSGLVRGLEAAERLGASLVAIYADSELVVRQITGRYRVRNEGLKPLYAEARALLEGFEGWTIEHVRRERNARADAMANLAMDARADVVEVDRSGESGAEKVAGPVSKDVAGGCESRPVVVVRCVKTGDGVRCGGCRYAEGQDQRVADVVPDGFCVYAAAAMMDKIVAMHEAIERGQVDGESVLVESACGSVFDLTSGV